MRVSVYMRWVSLSAPGFMCILFEYRPRRRRARYPNDNTRISEAQRDTQIILIPPRRNLKTDLNEMYEILTYILVSYSCCRLGAD